MSNPTTVTLTVDEIAFTRSAIRVVRAVTAIGLAIAIPAVLVLALPVLSYALLAGVILAPVLVGVALFRAARPNLPQAS